MSGGIGYKAVVISLVILFSGSDRVQAQTKKGRTIEVGFNMTKLIAQLVPFNRSGNPPLDYSFSWYRINRLGGGAIRISMGAVTVPSTNFFGNDVTLNLLLGYEKRKRIMPKMHGRFGVHFFANGGPRTRGLAEGPGFAWSAGLAYEFSDRVSLSTEVILYAGIGFAGGTFDFRAPASLFLNVKL